MKDFRTSKICCRKRELTPKMMSSDFELTDTGRLEATRNQKKRSSDTVAVNEAAVAIKLIQTGAKDELRLLLKENNSLVENAVDWVSFGT